jgi:ketosteroid isomerase-like protein
VSGAPFAPAGRGTTISAGGSPAPTWHLSVEYTLEHVLEDDDMVAVHATARGTTSIGHEYENEYHFLFRLEGGRIAEGWEFLGTAYVYARNT